jgi:hypothetical protein
MSRCRWCEREQDFHCMNSRDMEDFAIGGDDTCYQALINIGGGEKGLRYVALNRRDSGDSLT